MGLEQLFWSSYYEKDASLLAQDILFKARTNIKCAEEEVAKLKYVQLAVSEGVGTLGQTLCKDCNSKLHNKCEQLLESITVKTNQKKMRRLPVERQHFIKELECILIQKEMCKHKGDLAEQYTTTDEWYEQEIADLKVKHKSEIKELQRERDILMEEVSDLKKHEDQYKTQITKLQKTIGSNEIIITTQKETIEHKEKERKEDMDKNERLRDILKMKDRRIVRLTQPNQEQCTQTYVKRETEKKSSSWFSLGGDSRKEEQIKTLSVENKNLQLDLQKAQGEKAQTALELQQTSKELEKVHSQLDKLRNENATLAADLQEHKEKFEKAEENLSSDTHRILQEKEQIEKTLQKTNSELTLTKSQLEKSRTENKALTDDIREQLENAEEKLISHTNSTFQEKEQIEKTLQKANSELALTKSQLEKSRTENKALTDDIRDKGMELQTLREHLEGYRHQRKKSIVMGLHCSRSGLGKPLVEMVVRELTKGVQDRLDRNSTNLAIQFSHTPSEVTCWLKVVLCLNMSGVGTNILDVLKGMKGDRDVFVLVLHHTNKANLSSVTPTSHRITGSELRQLGGILDMAFSSDSGLYNCDLNNNAIDKIASVLKKYMMI
ncbi:rho-associated protein kinase 2-like isoform X1 [Pecten maximus]|uniref:rho-associated protein kinase 2-like isoform X1 n=1 Tax=Pecten maximus TaxID=6579 RepID=UPI001458083B|nr:rho-associated protein kinase 2-like isoform X1 [Pecten maximus]